MSEPRVTTALWVSAFIRRLLGDGHFAVVLAKGDPVAGALIVCSRSISGAHRLYSPITTLDGTRAWMETRSGVLDDAGAVTALAAAQQRDPDLWWVEAEIEGLAPYLDGPILTNPLRS
jgi:hypothetical protein